MNKIVVVEKLAFESPEINGHRIGAWYLTEPKGDCLVKITKGDDLIREFLYPAYKIWNLAAHADEIIANEVEKNMDGYRRAGSGGLVGGVMPRPVKVSEMMENWPPLEKGTRVRTIAIPDVAGDWAEEAKALRKFGVHGTIIHHHDSHGLCYDVRHDDGTEGCYDSEELVVLVEGREIQVGEILELLHEWGWEDHDGVCPKDGSPCRHSRANIALKEVKNAIQEIGKRRSHDRQRIAK